MLHMLNANVRPMKNPGKMIQKIMTQQKKHGYHSQMATSRPENNISTLSLRM
jgi:hypothetical protein